MSPFVRRGDITKIKISFYVCIQVLNCRLIADWSV